MTHHAIIGTRIIAATIASWCLRTKLGLLSLLTDTTDSLGIDCSSLLRFYDTSLRVNILANFLIIVVFFLTIKNAILYTLIFYAIIRYMKPDLLSYETEFSHPDTQVSLHWWYKNSTSIHYHNFYELFLVTEGKIRHICNGRQEILEARDLRLIRPSDIHQFSPYENLDCRHLNFAALPDIITKICLILNEKLWKKVENKNFYFCRKLREDEFERLTSLADKINFFTEQELDFTTSTIRMAISEALYMLSIDHDPFSADIPIWLKNIVEKLHEPDYLNITAKEIYSLSNYSPPMFLKYFKQYYGETFNTYFTKIKINYARNLLSKTNYTTLDIAGKLGYDSLSHFNRVFKKITAMSPNEYRKACKNRENTSKLQ